MVPLSLTLADTEGLNLDRAVLKCLTDTSIMLGGTDCPWVDMYSLRATMAASLTKAFRSAPLQQWTVQHSSIISSTPTKASSLKTKQACSFGCGSTNCIYCADTIEYEYQ